MAKAALRPYLITKDEEGAYRVVVRSTRFNSQRYPIVTSTPVDGSFPSITRARAYIREQFRAEAADIATE